MQGDARKPITTYSADFAGTGKKANP